MSKRFIDTNIFNDEWFMDLSVEAKLFYIYLFTNCNHAGIVQLNEKLCLFQTKLKSLITVKEELSNRLVTVKDNIYFLPKFIPFQYPNFPNSKVKQQESAIKMLESYGLFSNGLLTVAKPLPKGYDNDTDNEYVNKKEEKIYSLFNRTYKKIPNPAEVSEILKYFDKYGEKKTHQLLYGGAFRNIKSISYLLKNIDSNGDLIPYGDKKDEYKPEPVQL